MINLDFTKARVLIVGDVMLDKYQYGIVSRISPEAPVPVVKVSNTTYSLGGAGNVALNISKLNGKAHLISLTGKDENAKLIKELLNADNISNDLINLNYKTITKERVVSGHQQIVRLDFEEKIELDKKTIEEIKSKIKRQISKIDTVVISDYGKGFCTDYICSYIIELAHKYNKPVIVDPKGVDWNKYIGAEIITPNLSEFSKFLNKDIDNSNESIEENVAGLFMNDEFNHVLITRSSKGMTLAKQKKITHIPANVREVYDVAGAGDTVVATIATALSCGIDLNTAVILSNIAAGIIVSKSGTAPIEYEDLLNTVESEQYDKEVKLSVLKSVIKELKNKKKKIIFTNGCFDILHRGHISYLKQAKKLGDVLIVGLNSDFSIRKIKGDTRPIIKQEDRVVQLSSLEMVDYVVVFEEDTPYKLIKSIRPDVLVKGGDYSVDEVVGKEFAKDTKIINYIPSYSTTDLINKIKNINQ